MTFPTRSATFTVPPTVAFAMVVVTQNGSSPFYLLNKDCPRHPCGCRMTNFILNSFLRCNHQSVYVPLDTIASLPKCSTQVAKLSFAPTGHVVTSMVELHNSVATWTRLPPLTLCKCLERFVRCADVASITWVSRFLTARTGICKTARTCDREKG